jgi:hypothetical protein
MKRLPLRWLASTSAGFVGLVAFWSFASEPNLSSPPELAKLAAKEASAPDSDANSTRMREGTRLSSHPGSFKVLGDGVTFVSSDGKLKLPGLENLALERVARTVSENPDPLEWIVSGAITEYRGANYLLVTHAVLKPRAPKSGNMRSSF